MDLVLRALAVYLLVLVVIRASGRRTLGQMTAFDFVLLLIIAEATQQAMIGEDASITGSAIVVLTLAGADIGLSWLKLKYRWVGRVIDGLPTIIVENGQPLRDRLRKARINEEDILSAARQHRGLARMEQIRYAVLEADGRISVIPKE